MTRPPWPACWATPSTRVVLMTQTRGAREARYLLPGRERPQGELKGLLEERTEDDSVVVAFAGHGVEPADSNTPYVLRHGRQTRRQEHADFI